MLKIESDEDFNREIEKLIDNANFLKKMNDKFKGKKIQGQQLRIFIEDIEENIFNIFNYSLKIDNKPIKTKIIKMRGSYNKNNNFVNKNKNKINDNKIIIDDINGDLESESEIELDYKNIITKFYE